MTENIEAFELWVECVTQWRSGPGGLIGIDYAVIYLEAERLGIDLSPCLFKKIKHLERIVLRGQHDSNDNSTDRVEHS